MDQSKLHGIIASLSQLPSSKENKEKFLQDLEQNTEKAISLLSSCEELNSKISKEIKVTPKYVLTSLQVLKLLVQCTNDDSPSNLISVQQQQKIKILLQMIFSIGLAPSLFRGVNMALKNKTSQLYLSHLEELTLIESYSMMSEVVRSLVQILSAPSLRSLILTHLSDLMSALIQLIYTGEFKKPIKNPNSESKKSVNENSGDFVMTKEWYTKLLNDRNEFKVIYKDLVDNIYKPLVIRELLILLAPCKSIEDNEMITPPAWLRKAVSYQLTGYLTSPGGVSLIMRAMCDSSAESVDWKKVEGIAKLISTVHGNLMEEEFFSIISPQIISLLNTTGPYCVPVAKSCIKNIYKDHNEICDKYIFDKLFEPFIICSKPVAENFNGTLVSEESLSRCIDHLVKCFAPGSKESSIPISVLLKIIKIIYQLYLKVAKSPYQLKTAVQDLLIEFLYSQKDIKRLTMIYNALIFKEQHKEILEMNQDLEFQFGPSGGVQVGKRLETKTSVFPGTECELEFEIAGDHMLDLLSHNQEYSRKLLSDLFVILLSILSEFQYSKMEVPSTNPELLGVEELIVFLVGISQKRVITIKLLADLAENIHVIESIQENPEIVFKFIENLLETRAKDVLKNKESLKGDSDSESDDSRAEDPEDLFVVLAVVDLMTINVKSNSDRWNMFKSLLKPIEIIRDNYEDSFIKHFSDLLIKRIATHGAISGSKKPQLKSFSNEKMASNLDAKVACNINEMKKKDESKLQSGKSKKNKHIIEVKEDDHETKEFDIVLKEICSEDIPTRGHAIIQLRNLIKKRDSDTLTKKDYVFTILKCNLTHKDTYIYLAAINALESLACIIDGNIILELLCDEYTEHKKDFSELQMKIGEVLMRIIRDLGELVPKHKALLINTFLFGAKSSDEFLRVSSLSNLGELLKLLGYGLGSIIHEVFVCVESIAKTDKSDMARRAAVMVIQLLLRGVSENTFMVLESVIRDLYRTLRHIYTTDKDEVTRLHADLALSEISRLVQSSFNKPLKLEKHIGILGLPRRMNLQDSIVKDPSTEFERWPLAGLNKNYIHREYAETNEFPRKPVINFFSVKVAVENSKSRQ